MVKGGADIGWDLYLRDALFERRPFIGEMIIFAHSRPRLATKARDPDARQDGKAGRVRDPGEQWCWRASRFIASGKADGRIGAGLLLDALTRTLQAADIGGIRALAIRAKDEAAAYFYRHFGFVPSPTDKRHLFMLIKDIRAMSGG